MRPVLPIISAAAVAALLAACATGPAYAPMPPRPAPPPPPPPTPMEEFAWSTRSGTNALFGTIAYSPPTPGQTWSCSGQSVALTPETSYSRGRMLTLYGSAERALRTVDQVRSVSAANPGMDYSEFVRSTTCDAQDSFTFGSLPDGAYHIIARVRQVHPPSTDEGIVVMQRVELRGGQAMRIILPQSPPNASPF